MDFYRESSKDLEDNPVVHYRASRDDEAVGLVARVGGVWRAYYRTPGHTTDHADRHEAEMAVCEAILGA